MLYYTLGCVFYVMAKVAQGADNCTEPCTSSLLYDDLKCKPVFELEGDCCPIQYDCSHIDNRPDGQCHLGGRFYKPDDAIDDDLIYGNCHVGCRCTESAEYNCAVLDCPEWLGNIPKPGCYLKYELNKCCAMGEVCPPFDDIVTCKVGDKVHRQGERFSPPDEKCVECVCAKDFDGKFEEPFCRKLNCTAEILHSKEIRENCAPAYRDDRDCCPWEWVCPDAKDVIETAADIKSADIHCKFGDKHLYIGDKFTRTKKEPYLTTDHECECKVPPFLTCNINYDSKSAPPPVLVQYNSNTEKP